MKKYKNILMLLLFFLLSASVSRLDVMAEESKKASAELKSVEIATSYNEGRYDTDGGLGYVPSEYYQNGDTEGNIYEKAVLQENNIFLIHIDLKSLDREAIFSNYLFITGERASKTAEVTIKDLSDPANKQGRKGNTIKEYVTTEETNRYEGKKLDFISEEAWRLHYGTTCMELDVSDGDEHKVYYLVISSNWETGGSASMGAISYELNKVEFLNGKTKEKLADSLQTSNWYYSSKIDMPDEVPSVRLRVERKTGELQRPYAESNLLYPDDFFGFGECDTFYRKDSNWVSVNGGRWSRVDGDGKGYSQELILKKGLNMIQIRGCSDKEWNLEDVEALENDTVLYGTSVFFIYREGDNTYSGTEDDKTGIAAPVQVYRATKPEVSPFIYDELKGWKYEVEEKYNNLYISCSTADKYLLLDARPNNPDMEVVVGGATSNIGGRHYLEVDAKKFNEDTPISIQLKDKEGNILEEESKNLYIRWQEGDAKLADVKVQGGNLSPEYNDSTLRYILTPDENVEKIGMTLTPADNVRIQSIKVDNKAIRYWDETEDFPKFVIDDPEKIMPEGYENGPMELTIPLDKREIIVTVDSEAEGNKTEKTYEFHWPLETEGISSGSKEKAKKILDKTVNAMVGEANKNMGYPTKFDSSWFVFELASAGESLDGYNVHDVDTDDYTQATTYARNILQLIATGENPYEYKDENGKNLIDGLLNERVLNGGGYGGWGNNIWALMALDAVGEDYEDKNRLVNTVINQAMSDTFDLDMRGWALLAAQPHKDEPGMKAKIASAVRGIKKMQITGEDAVWSKLCGSFKHMQYNNININTHGCVVSGLVAAGLDPGAPMWTENERSALDVFELFQREDGKFYWRTEDGEHYESAAYNKDAVIALGDIVHGSNVWNRMVLTQEKVDKLIADAEKMTGGSEEQKADLKEKIAAAKAASADHLGRPYFELLASMAKIDPSVKTNVRMCTTKENDQVNEVIAAIDGLKGQDISKQETRDAVVNAGKLYDALATDKLKGYIANYAALKEMQDKKDAFEKELLEQETGMVDNVIKMIEDLGKAEDITAESENAIAEARKAYEALRDELKARITNIKALETAEMVLPARKAEALIGKLPAVIALADKAAIDEARNSYNALTEMQKEYVRKEILEKLEKAESDYQILDVTEKIKALPDSVTAADVVAVQMARKAYDALGEEQKKLVDGSLVARLAKAEEQAAKIPEQEKDAAAAKSVTDAIRAISQQVTKKDKAAIEAARQAYNALTDSQKNLVAKGDVDRLAKAEQKLKEILDKEAQDAAKKVTGVSFNKTSITLEKGKSYTLKATIAPKDAANKKVRWDSSNKKVATVKNGTVTAHKAGTSRITVITEDGKKQAVCTVKVTEPKANAKNVTAKKINGITEKVNTSKKGTANLVKVNKSNKKTITIASTVSVKGVTYTVTSIGSNAFSNCKNAATVSIPSTVTTIKKNAFTGAKKLKTIVFNGNKPAKIAKGAFKGLNTSKMTIKVSKKMSKKNFNSFKKALKKAGFKGKVKRK